jgi:thioesterase domain-containing protein
MREVAVTLKSSSTSLLSVAVRLAEAGQDAEAMVLIDLAKGIQEAEDKVRRHKLSIQWEESTCWSNSN